MSSIMARPGATLYLGNKVYTGMADYSESHDVEATPRADGSYEIRYYLEFNVRGVMETALTLEGLKREGTVPAADFEAFVTGLAKLKIPKNEPGKGEDKSYVSGDVEANGSALSFRAYVESKTSDEVVRLIHTLLSKATMSTVRTPEVHPGVKVPAQSIDFAEFLKDTETYHQKRVRLKGYYLPPTDERPYPCLAIDKDQPAPGPGVIDLGLISSFAPDAKTLAWPKESKLLEVEGSFRLPRPGLLKLGSQVGRLAGITRIDPAK